MPTRKWGSEFLVNTILTNNQFNSDVAGLAGGGFVVVWQDNGTTDSAIRAQRYDALGNQAGGEMTIASAAGIDFTAPAVTALADGSFYVTATQVGAADNFILGSVWDANGALVRSQHPAFAFGMDTNSDVARLGTGSVAVWVDPDANNGDISFRIFDAAGNGGPILTANAGTIGTQKLAAVAGAPGGNAFAVAWTSGDDPQSVFLRLFNSAGNQLVPEFNVAQVANGEQTLSDVAWLNNQQFVVAWTDQSGAGGTGHSIKARVFNSFGAAITGEFTVNSTTVSTQSLATITALPNGGFVIAWEDLSRTGGDNSGYAIRLQAFDASGTKIGGEFLVNTTTNNNQVSPSVAALTDGRVVVTWTDHSSSILENGPTDIRMQIIDPRDGIVTGNATADTLYGHDAVGDEISGFDADDTMYGLKGNDSLYGGAGADTGNGGGGDDVIYGGADNDDLRGGNGEDDLYGEDGNDTLAGGKGEDNLNGGAGTDTASYSSAKLAVTVALDGSLVGTGEAEGDTFTSVEILTGSAFADTLKGDSLANVLNGQAGADTLTGGNGSDTLFGGAGADTMTGGVGNDKIQYNTVSEAGDIITDFSSAAGDNDFFRFKLSAFGALGVNADGTGTLKAAFFQSRADNVAQDGNDRFIFNTTDKTLWFDADGNGVGAAVLIADLQNTATLTSSDITIF